jgi:hypothetical protein
VRVVVVELASPSPVSLIAVFALQAFRRGKNEEPARTFRLYGLDPATRYKITNLDVERSTISSGKDLMENGLRLDVKERPAAAVVLYTKADD